MLHLQRLVCLIRMRPDNSGPGIGGLGWSLILGVSLALGDWNSALSASSPVIPMKGPIYDVGFSKVDITPNYPIRLNGYFGRNVESTNAVQPLYAKALAIGSDKQGAAVLISVDNCIVPKAVYDDVVNRISKHGV